MIRFGNLELPPELAVYHFLFAGAPGSGKTVMLRLLLQSGLASIGVDGDGRAIVRDAKGDIVPQLAAIAPHADRVITHPFDDRGCEWKMWEDFNEPQLAIELMFTLIPPLAESQPYFTDAVRHLGYGVVLSFLRAGLEWRLADLIRVMQSRRLLKVVLGKYAETRHIARNYLGDKKLAYSVLSTAATKFLPFEPVAAAWEHAKRQVSLTEWARSPMISILGSSHVGRTPLATLARCMFKRAADITLDQSESTTRRNWFVVDELSDAGKLDGLVSLAKMGRSKGACLVVAFQSIDGLRDAQLYGPQFSEEFLAQIANRFIGRVESAASAEWASQLIGDQEIDQATSSQTTSKDGTSHSVSRQRSVRRAVLPSEFLSIPLTHRRNGLSGLFFVPEIGVFRDRIDGPELFDRLLLPPADIPAFIPRPVDCQFLRPWTPERAAHFGIPEKRPSRSPESTQQPRPTVERDELDDLFS